MAKLSTPEKQVLEKLLGMQGGYVLNFSDKTFAEFFKDDLNIDIFDQRYNYASGSKANRMRGFWGVASDGLVASSVLHLLAYIDTHVALGRLQAAEYPEDLLQRARAISARLSGQPVPIGPPHAKTVESATGPQIAFPEADAATIVRLRGELISLQSLAPQKRGFAFERFLDELFHSFHLSPRRSFRLTGEQIDGSFQLGQDVYLVEAKWENHKTSQADLLTFSGKVEGKAQWSRGVFISYSGFTPEGLEAFAIGRPTRILCMDAFDTYCVLDRRLHLADIVNRKMRRASETNEAFVSVRELYPDQSF